MHVKGGEILPRAPKKVAQKFQVNQKFHSLYYLSICDTNKWSDLFQITVSLSVFAFISSSECFFDYLTRLLITSSVISHYEYALEGPSHETSENKRP